MPFAGVMAGGLAILVHLLGAGGIEMPAIMQTVLLVVVFLFGASWEAEPSSIKPRPKIAAAFSGLAILCAMLCWQTAMMPVWYRTLFIRSGDAAYGQDANPKAAAKWYEDAHAVDAFSPEPLERLAELHFQAWRRSSADRDFKAAVDEVRKAMPLDPVSYRLPRRLGLMYHEKAKRSSSLGDAKRAAEYLTEAVDRYPSSSELRAELALALEQAGQSEESAHEAKMALELDQINRKAGHIDKFLPEPLVKTLEKMLRAE
jgi:tetratricopeptide (TPR) repeat protein